MGFLSFFNIAIDWSFFNQLAAQNPLGAALMLLRAGGWIPLVILFLIAAKQVYLIKIRRRWGRKQRFILLAIDIPKGNEQSPRAVEHIFAYFFGLRSSINFKEKWIEGRATLPITAEIVSHGGDVQFYIRAPAKHRDSVEAAIYSQYPDAEITEVEDYAKQFPRQFPNEKYNMFGCDFKLEREEMFPLRTYPQFEHQLSGEFKDPMSLILESMGGIGKEEYICLQIIMFSAGDEWRGRGHRKLQTLLGRKVEAKKGLIEQAVDLFFGFLGGIVDQILSRGEEVKPEKKKDDMFKMMMLSPGERHLYEAVEIKLSKVGLLSKVRYIQFGPHETFRMKYYAVKGFLRQFASLDSNYFGSVSRTFPKGDYFWQRWQKPVRQRAIMKAYIGRDDHYGGPLYILNTEELATLWHFPVKEVKAPAVKKTEAKTAEPPRGLPMR